MSIKELITKIKTGNPEEVKKGKKEAKRKIEEKGAEVADKVIEEVKNFSRISKERNKIAFIYVLKQVAKKNPNEHLSLFTSFVVQNIEEDSGRVRQAVVRFADELMESLFTGDELTEREREVFSQFIDDLLVLLEKHYEEKFEEFNTVKDLPPSKFKSLELLLDKLIGGREMEEGRVYKKKTGMPDWMDCTWKRVPCRKEDCPVCSNLDEEVDATLFERGEALLSAAGKSDPNREGPPPDSFPFYGEVRDWIEKVVEITEKSTDRGEFWVFTEEAADLLWYLNVLSVKTYRQLTNRYDLDRGEKKTLDYKYTRYVLKESVKEIKKSLKDIQNCDPSQKSQLRKAFEDLSDLEERIYNI